MINTEMAAAILNKLRTTDLMCIQIARQLNLQTTSVRHFAVNALGPKGFEEREQAALKEQRRKAAELYAQGYCSPQVANQLNVTLDCLYRYHISRGRLLKKNVLPEAAAGEPPAPAVPEPAPADGQVRVISIAGTPIAAEPVQTAKAPALPKPERKAQPRALPAQCREEAPAAAAQLPAGVIELKCGQLELRFDTAGAAAVGELLRTLKAGEVL